MLRVGILGMGVMGWFHATQYARLASRDAGGSPHFLQMVEALARADHDISQ